MLSISFGLVSIVGAKQVKRFDWLPAFRISYGYRGKPSVTDPKKFSWRNRRMGFANAFRGIRVMLITQHNAWVHAIVMLVVCATGIAFRISSMEWCCLVLCFMAVWTTEALNTALELLTDLASPEFHPLAGRAKDVAAGAVLIAAIGSAIVGGIVFVPHVWKMATRN